MSNLYLIATNHLDIVRGPEKLLRVYDRINPDLILSETSADALAFLREYYSGLEERFMRLTTDKKGVRELIDYFLNFGLGFEINTNEQYAQKHGIENHLVDRSFGQEKIFQFAKNTMDEALREAEKAGRIDIRGLNQDIRNYFSPSQDKIRRYWTTLKRNEGNLLGEIPIIFCRFVLGRTGPSDKYMEQRLREIYDPNKVIAFPLGMIHCIDSISRSTIYSRIKDLHPVRIPLLD
jgi:hypothetical protein